MKFGVIVFPGSNCDTDCFHVIDKVLGCPVDYIWHKETSLRKYDVLVLPGGFSYGDYLRCGAIAKFSPVMNEVCSHAKKGGLVIGICNGFQILIEVGLLPGALIRNASLKFICDSVFLKLKNHRIPFTIKGEEGGIYRMPVAHMDGNYFIEPDGLKKIKDNNQIVFQYTDAKGNLSPNSNPNGSLNSIAGICSKEGNVMGMMPHPERVAEDILGGCDGRFVFESLMTYT